MTLLSAGFIIFTMFDIKFQDNNTYILVDMEGNIDYNHENEIKEYLSNIVNMEKHIIIDLKGAKYIDSTGLNIFVSLSKKLSAIKKTLFFYRPVNTIKQVFKMTNLHTVIPIIEDSEELESTVKGF